MVEGLSSLYLRTKQVLRHLTGRVGTTVQMDFLGIYGMNQLFLQHTCSPKTSVGLLVTWSVI